MAGVLSGCRKAHGFLETESHGFLYYKEDTDKNNKKDC